MKSLRLILLSVFASMLLTACGAPHYFIDADWTENSKPTNVKVVFSMPKVAEPDDLRDDLPEYTSNFAKWFGPELKENLVSRSRDNVHYSMSLIQRENISYKKKELGDDEFSVPYFDLMKNDADIYLVVSNVWIGRESETQWISNGVGTTMVTYLYFSMKCRYAFYDARTKKLLGYGHSKGRTGYTFAVTRSDWESSLRKMVYNLARETPLFVR